jgi:hypothetical protein
MAARHDNHLVEYNVINLLAQQTASGIRFNNPTSGTADHNVLFNNTINQLTTGPGTALVNYAVYLRGASNNNFSSMYVNGSANTYQVADIYFTAQSDNNIFQDVVLAGNNRSIYGLGGINNTFINVSYSRTDYMSSNSEMIRKWYYQANVENSGGSPVVADVTARNASGNPALATTTDGNGITPIKKLTDYIKIGDGSGGIRHYASNYTIDTTSGPLADSHTINVTDAASQSSFEGLITETIVVS